MAAVSVFVDDAIQGRLPLVCAKTGEPTDLVIRMQQQVGGGLGLIWLLLLLGPLGLVALVFLSVATPGSEYLTVRIPQTRAAYEREQSLGRLRLAAFGLAVAALLCGVLSLGMFPALWLLSAVALLVTGIAAHVMVWRQSIGITLDASRRWVTLTSVHPAFARAVELQGAGTRSA